MARDGLMPCSTRKCESGVYKDRNVCRLCRSTQTTMEQDGLQDFCTQGQASHFLTNPKCLHPCRQCRVAQGSAGTALAKMVIYWKSGITMEQDGLSRKLLLHFRHFRHPWRSCGGGQEVRERLWQRWSYTGSPE